MTLFLVLALACGTETPDEAAELPSGTPTWNQDIAPLVTERCAGCHAPGEIGPFPLDTYAAAAPMAAAMASAVESGSMPPWSEAPTDECTPRLGFKDDLSLSDAEKAELRAWADAGAPEGNAEAVADLPVPVSLTLEGANQHVEPAVGFAASGNHDQFMCFVMDPGLSATSWLTGLQVEAGNPAVVHHALIFADDSGDALSYAAVDGMYECEGSQGLGGQLVGAWAPGAVPNVTPEGAGIEVAPGSLLVMQIHYHPTGETAETDVTGLDLRWAESAPAHKAVLALLGNAQSAGEGLLPDPDDREGSEFRIPANVSGHTETMEVKITDRSAHYQVYSAGTHMHYVGTDMAIWVDHAHPGADVPATECLVETPTWDFNWQRGYTYDAPLEEVPLIERGDTIRMRCTYDNTLDNPGVKQALSDAGETSPQDVYLGETTLDEMCLGVFGVVYE